MHLHSVTLSGFLGVPADAERGFEFDDLSHINLLIGPNNSGKSTILRFLLLIFPYLNQLGHINIPGLTSTLSWKQEDPPRIESIISFRTKTARSAEVFDRYAEIYDNQLRLAVRSTGRGVSIFPVVFDTQTGKWVETYQNREMLTDRGSYSRNSELMQPWQNKVKEHLKGLNWGFFDAVRTLSPLTDSLAQRVSDDGSRLLKEMHEMQNKSGRAKEWLQFKEQLLTKLNRIFTVVGIPQIADLYMSEDEVGSAIVPSMSVVFSTDKTLPIRIDTLGMGVQQLIIVLAKLTKHEAGPPIAMFIEEIETNLHPGLIRQILPELRKHGNVQFVITTHSSALLDSTAAADTVYAFHQDSDDGACTMRKVVEPIHKYKVLDRLGVSASTILQSNSVIWVEGPSDRLYIRRWLLEANPGLVEHVDFSFAFYGGALLAHCSLEVGDDRAATHISLLSVCRFGIVVMDRDQSPREPEEKLWPRKRSIIGDSKADEEHRYAALTDGWEIENDIRIECFRAAATDMLKLEKSRLDQFCLTGDKPYEEELVEWLRLEGDEARSAKRRLSDKLELADAAIRYCENTQQSLGGPSYLKRILNLVTAARATPHGGEPAGRA